MRKMSADTSESDLRAQLAREGLNPERWSNGPHAVYAAHEHPYAKVLMVVSGSMMFTVAGGRVVPMIPPPVRRPNGPVTANNGQRSGGAKASPWKFGRSFRVEAVTGPPTADPRQVVGMKPGDRLDLPAHTSHSALVGSHGVVCLEAHRDS